MKKNKTAYKALLHTIKILIISTCLLYGPSTVRSAAHSISKSDKSYELDSKDEMLKEIAAQLKELGINNSIIASKIINNMARDGFFTIYECRGINYNILDESDYNLILNGACTEHALTELTCKILNYMFEDEVNAYNVKIDSHIKKEFDPDELFVTHYINNMCLIHDKKLELTYLYSPFLDKYVRMDNLNNTVDKYSSYSTSWFGDLVSGKYNVFELLEFKNNKNDVFPQNNFDKLSQKADEIYKYCKENNLFYDINRITTDNKYKIYIKELEGRIPE